MFINLQKTTTEEKNESIFWNNAIRYFGLRKPPIGIIKSIKYV